MCELRVYNASSQEFQDNLSQNGCSSLDGLNSPKLAGSIKPQPHSHTAEEAITPLA